MRRERSTTPATVPLGAVAPMAPVAPLPTVGTSGGRRGAGAAAFVLAVVTAGALAHVALKIKGLEVAYDLGRERRIRAELEEQRRSLQIEIGTLKDPGRMVALARDRLKMGPPPPEAIRSLEALRAMGGAAAAPPPAGRAAAPPRAPAGAAKPAAARGGSGPRRGEASAAPGQGTSAAPGEGR